jgi:hypothetical protein
MANIPKFFFTNTSFSIARIEYIKGKWQIAKNIDGNNDIVTGKGLWKEVSQKSGTIQNTLQSNNKQIIVMQVETYDVELQFTGYELTEKIDRYRIKKGNQYYEIIGKTPYLAVVKGAKYKLREIEPMDIKW